MANAGQVLARCFAQFLVWGPEGFSFVHCLKHLDVFLRVFVRTIFGCLLATSLIPVTCRNFGTLGFVIWKALLQPGLGVVPASEVGVVVLAGGEARQW